MKLDLHVHTCASSDGLIKPRALIRTAIKRGLAGIAVTDHNTTAGVAAVAACAPMGFTVIPGAEYSTDMGHILALYIDSDVSEGLSRDPLGRVKLSELSPAVRSAGGLLIAAHPFHARDELPEGLTSLVDALETHNAREMCRKPSSVEQTEAAAAGLWRTGGSDAHIKGELGRAYTVLPDGCNIKYALSQGLGTAEGQPAKPFYLLVSKLYRRWRRYERTVLRFFKKRK